MTLGEVLREAGLIEDRRDGWNVFYRIVDQSIFLVIEAAKAALGETVQPPLAVPNGCDCPKCSAVPV